MQISTGRSDPPRRTPEARPRVNEELLRNLIQNGSETISRHFFPAGRKEGAEWKIGDVSGAPGSSLGIQLSGEKDKIGLCHDRATGQGWNLVALLMEHLGVDFPEVARRIGALFGINLLEEPRETTAKPVPKSIDFSRYVAAFTPDWEALLEKQRGYSRELVDCLLRNQKIGVAYVTKWYENAIVFPVTDPDTDVVLRLHCWSN